MSFSGCFQAKCLHIPNLSFAPPTHPGIGHLLFFLLSILTLNIALFVFTLLHKYFPSFIPCCCSICLCNEPFLRRFLHISHSVICFLHTPYFMDSDSPLFLFPHILSYTSSSNAFGADGPLMIMNFFS